MLLMIWICGFSCFVLFSVSAASPATIFDEPSQLCRLSEQLLTSINFQLVHVIDSIEDKYRISEQLHSLASNSSGASSETKLLNEVSYVSALLFQYIQLLGPLAINSSDLKSLSLFSLESFKELSDLEMKTVWLSIQGTSDDFTRQARHFIDRAAAVVTHDARTTYEIIEGNYSVNLSASASLLSVFKSHIMEDSRVTSPPLSLFDIDSRILQLHAGTGELAGWLRDTAWFTTVDALDEAEGIESVSRGAVRHGDLASISQSGYDYIVSLEESDLYTHCVVPCIVRVPKEVNVATLPVNVAKSVILQQHTQDGDLFYLN